MDERLSEVDYQALLKKIERELPVRLKLAELAGLPKINSKNFPAMMKFDMTIKELYLEIVFRKPENVEAALQVIRDLYK